MKPAKEAKAIEEEEPVDDEEEEEPVDDEEEWVSEDEVVVRVPCRG